MAVHAQYPSNVLLLNRSLQETKPVVGGGGGDFLDQSHMLFNNGVGTNTRKRGRESESTMFPINKSFSIQNTTQSSQLIDLALLHNSQPNVVSTGLQLASGNQQHRQLQMQQQQQHQQQQTIFPQFCNSVQSSTLSEDLGTQIRQHKHEIEHFLQTQAEELRRTLAEKRQRHYGALLGALEESVARRLREKEAEAEKAVRRYSELEARAAQLGSEARAWHAKARAQESVAATLQAQLQQTIMSGMCAQQQDDRGIGLKCAGGVEGQAEDAESGYVDPDRVVVTDGRHNCKACGYRVASIVLLPCRHLCLCSVCDAVVQTCPICFSSKNSSIEVFFS